MNTYSITQQDRFFAVTNKATNQSEIGDVKFETNIEKLGYWFRGGRVEDCSSIILITDNESEAFAAAYTVLCEAGAYHECPICDEPKPASAFTRNTSATDEWDDDPCDACWDERDRYEADEVAAKDERYMIEFTDTETAFTVVAMQPFKNVRQHGEFVEFETSIEMKLAASWLNERGMTIPEAALHTLKKVNK